MVNYFTPMLINSPNEDSGIYLAVSSEKRAILIDCGDNRRLALRDLLRVTDVFISHTHIDHFIGLDNVIRANIRLSKTIRVYGPPGITAQVHHKMLAYTWNLLMDQALELRVYEIGREEQSETLLSYKDAFRQPHHVDVTPLSGKIVRREPHFHVTHAWLDHKIPCLGYAFIVPSTWLVDKEKLAAFGEPPGLWIRHLKAFLENNAPTNTQITVGDKQYSVSELKEKLLVIQDGQKIAYVTDTIYSPETQTAIVELAKDADFFFCEAHFAEEEATKAKEAYHLTARQAGIMAALAGAKVVIGFHYSPRYVHGKQRALEKELEDAYKQQRGIMQEYNNEHEKSKKQEESAPKVADNLWKKAVASVGETLGAMEGLASKTAETLGTMGIKAVEDAAASMEQITNKAVQLTSETADKLVQSAGDAAQSLEVMTSQAIRTTKQAAEKMAEVVENVPNMVNDVADKSKQVLSAVGSGISTVANTVINTGKFLTDTDYRYSVGYPWLQSVVQENWQKIQQELGDSQDMLMVLWRYSQGEELTPQEREAAQSQLKRIVAMVPAFAIFCLPGGAILLPLLARALPWKIMAPSFREKLAEKYGDAAISSELKPGEGVPLDTSIRTMEKDEEQLE